MSEELITVAPEGARVGIRHPGLLAWLRLARVFQKVDRASADGLRCQGLSVAQFDVLARVGSDDGLMQQELADSLLVTKGNVCQLIDRMEQAGLVARCQEGRANRLHLTDKGRAAFGEVVPQHEELIVQLFSALTSEEQSQLLELLRKLDRALE